MTLQKLISFDKSMNRNRETGIVLVVAMIALVIMSLAAVALIRSVDTSTLIAGNISFRQSATISADSGMESAITWLSANNTDSLTTANGYYATSNIWCTSAAGTTCQDTSSSTFNVQLGVTSDAIWDSTTRSSAVPSGKDSSGNTTRYIIQRMCRAAGAPTTANCLLGTAEIGSSSKGIKDATGGGGCVGCSSLSPMYRVTARVIGPKNTVSYIQAYVY
jgi:Tfp pilus assembly protein PilX